MNIIDIINDLEIRTDQHDIRKVFSDETIMQCAYQHMANDIQVASDIDMDFFYHLRVMEMIRTTFYEQSVWVEDNIDKCRMILSKTVLLLKRAEQHFYRIVRSYAKKNNVTALGILTYMNDHGIKYED